MHNLTDIFLDPSQVLVTFVLVLKQKKFVFLKNKYISVILAFVVCSLKLVTSAVGISLPLIFSI